MVDVSASLMIYIDDIVREMRDSIRGLIPTQKFHIVLARPRQVEELASRRLVPAIARYKKEADTFLATIDRIPKPGKADPIEAMRRAFAVGPDLIYFLSDGDYTDIENELDRELQRLNLARRCASRRSVFIRLGRKGGSRNCSNALHSGTTGTSDWWRSSDAFR